MLSASAFTPSRQTALTVLAFAAATGTVLFSALSADINCGSQHWTCASFSGIAVVAFCIGAAFGLFLAAMLALALAAARRVWAKAPVLEPPGRTPRVVVALLLTHLGAFGAVNLLGFLPLGWLWWLGALGFLGMGGTGQAVYLVR